jgi:serine O-acetyltransferase
LNPGKRHPTIEDDVVIGAGAAVLGPFTVGSGARIGSNAVVLREVPPGATMVGVPARQVGPQPATKERCFPAYGVEPGVTIDPVSRALDRLTQELEELNARVAQLERPTEQGPEVPAPERRAVAS